MRTSNILAVMGSILAFTSTTVLAQGEPEAIEVPKNDAWTAQVNLASVPQLAVRPVGSGMCDNPKCDGSDNDKCFESCGNKANGDDIYGCPKAKQWALTFDDGPSNYTSDLLDMLDTANVKVTFCVMGAHVRKYPEILKRAYESGHHIASHTYSHPHLMSLSNEEIIAEMKATEEAIVDAIGVKPTYMRPPFGEADDRVKGLMKAMGYKILLWNADPTDYNIYKEANVGDKIKATFKQAVTGIDTGLNAHEDPGFISLQHDLYTQSIAEVPAIIDLLRASQFELVTAAECLGDKNPYQNLAAASKGGNEFESTSQNKTSSATSISQPASSTGKPNDQPIAQPSIQSNSQPSTVPNNGTDSVVNAQIVPAKSNASTTSFMPIVIGFSCLFSIFFML